MFDRLAGRASRRARRHGRGPGGGDLAPAHERLRHRDRPAGRRRPPARRPLTCGRSASTTPTRFSRCVGPFLGAREAEHNLALGLLGRLRVEPRLYGFDPTFVVVEEAGDDRRLPAADAAPRRRAQPLRGSRGRGCRRRRGDRHAPGATGRRRAGGGGGPVRRHVVALDRCPGPDRRSGSASTPRRKCIPCLARPGTCARPGRTMSRPSSSG